MFKKLGKENKDMTDKLFITVKDVAETLQVSNSYAYQIMRKLNAELEEMGYITVTGKINTQYFLEKTCYKNKSDK